MCLSAGQFHMYDGDGPVLFQLSKMRFSRLQSRRRNNRKSAAVGCESYTKRPEGFSYGSLGRGDVRFEKCTREMILVAHCAQNEQL